MSPRTLSRALDLLEARGEIARQADRKEVRYSLVVDIPPEKLAPIWVNADSMMVQSAARIGAVGARESAWTVYGIPVSLGHQMRGKLRREVEAFQGGLDDILDEMLSRSIHTILEKAKKRAPKTVLSRGERAIWSVYRRVGVTGISQAVGLSGLAAIEFFAPGAFARILEKINEQLPSDPGKALVAVASRLGESVVDAEAELKRAEHEGRAIDSLLATLSPRDRETLARRLADVLKARANLCAVVR